MTDDPRDPLDAAIARDLHALVPSDLDVDGTLGSMRPALLRARARRRLEVSGTAIAAIVILGGGGAFLAGRPSGHLVVESHATTVPIVSSTTSTRPDESTSTSTTTTSPANSITPIPSPTTSGPVPTSTSTLETPTTTMPTPTTTDEHHGGGGGGGGGGGPGTTSPPTSSTTTTTPPSSTKTYTSVGGTVTVTFAGGELTLDSFTPTDGYSWDVAKNTSDEIEVKFEKIETEDGAESVIRVRVVDGKVTSQITED